MKRLLFSLVTIMFCLVTQAIDYEVYVKGVGIEDSNMADVLNDGGTVSAAMNGDELVVTFNNAQLKHDNLMLNISNNCPASYVTLNVEGTNTLAVTNNNSVILTSKPLRFTGSGNLTLQSGYCGIMSMGQDVTIGTKVDIIAPVGITGTNVGVLEFTSTSSVNIDSEYGAITDFGQILLSGVEVQYPSSYSIANGSLKDTSGNIYKGAVSIGKPEVKYGLTIAGVEVTLSNRDDVLGDGKVSVKDRIEDGQDLTIIMDGANISTVGNAIAIDLSSKIRSLTIKTVGACSITSESASAIYVPYTSKLSSMTIYGDIDIKAEEYGVFHGSGSLYLRDAKSMNIESGKACLYSDYSKYLTVNNVSDLTLTPTDGVSSAIEGFRDLLFSDYVLFKTPGVVYDEVKKMHYQI